MPLIARAGPTLPTPPKLRQMIARLEMLSSATSVEVETLRAARSLLAIHAEGPAH